jgi:hypothetical protein
MEWEQVRGAVSRRGNKCGQQKQGNPVGGEKKIYIYILRT